jgi:hypothetical protein
MPYFFGILVFLVVLALIFGSLMRSMLLSLTSSAKVNSEFSQIVMHENAVLRDKLAGAIERIAWLSRPLDASNNAYRREPESTEPEKNGDQPEYYTRGIG